MKNKNSTPVWKLLKNYINSLEMDQQFTRKDLLDLIEDFEYFGSMDFYRYLLTKLEYIDSIRPGLFIKKDVIPENATLALIRTFADDSEDSWIAWFVPKEDRKNQIRKICEDALR